MVAGGGGKCGEGRESVIFGSSLVERAHNLLNGVWPLGVVEAEEPLTNLCVCVGGGCYQGSGAPWYRRVGECAV